MSSFHPALTVDVDGGTPREFTGTQLSSVGLSWGRQLTWAPGSRIVYQGARGRRLFALDPETGQQKPVASHPSGETVFFPRTSPDGRSVAVSGYGALWRLSLDDSSEERLNDLLGWSEGIVVPVGWSENGSWVAGWRFGEREIATFGWRWRPVVGEVEAGSPAFEAGLQPGDLIQRVDEEPIRTWLEFAAYIRERPDQNVVLSVDRDGETRELRAQIGRASVESGGKKLEIGRVGVALDTLIDPFMLRAETEDIPSALVRLPFEGDQIAEVSMTPGGSRFVVTVMEHQSDVWLIENFDPDVQ